MEMQIVSFKPVLCMNSDDKNNLSLRFFILKKLEKC